MKNLGAHSVLDRLLAWCESEGASDLHVKGGTPLRIRIDGRLEKVEKPEFPVPDDALVMTWIQEAFGGETAESIQMEREVDFSFQRDQVRYRANFSKQQGVQSFSFRHVPMQKWTLADLKLPDSLANLTLELRGLLLITGATGQGKSTTARALIEDLNRSKALRIITIEDPIEFVFTEDNCSIEQREVGIDTESFARGIRNAMRQDPDVIFIGELRDRESVHAGLQAAETGHLVLATLHADSVPQAISRIREFYPDGEQPNINSLLARNLNAIVCQRLLPDPNGKRIPCVEIMRKNAGIVEAVKDNDLKLLTGIIENALQEGMHSFDQYLVELLAAGMIDEDTARQNAVHPHQLELKLRGIQTSKSILKPDHIR